MKINYPPSGKYIVAVSGGVDSISLLHALVSRAGPWKQRKYDLVVAHVDHGWREDSAADGRFVGQLAESYNLPFRATRLELTKKTETIARVARWEFLETLMQEENAAAILTAHHADDISETMVINLKRGTGRSGLTSLKNTKTIFRPLLGEAKQEIYDYAVKNKLEFIEDSTNADLQYTRNKIRALLSGREKIVDDLQKIYNTMLRINAEIDTLLGGVEQKISIPSEESKLQKIRVKRKEYLQLDIKIQAELLRYMGLQLNPDASLNREQIERGVAGITNALPGKITELGSRLEIQHHKEISTISLISTPRMEVLK